MHPVLQHLIDTDFSDLQGSSVEGQFAVTDELVNLGLHELVSQLTKPASSTSTAPAAPAGDKTTVLPDTKLLLRKVKFEQLRYRTEAGRTVLEIKAGM